jgi:hypothetical protein
MGESRPPSQDVVDSERPFLVHSVENLRPHVRRLGVDALESVGFVCIGKQARRVAPVEGAKVRCGHGVELFLE